MSDVVNLAFGDGEFVNEPISAWENFSLTESFTDPLGSMTFTAGPPQLDVIRYRRLLRKGNFVTLSINNALQAKMLIVGRTTTISKKGAVRIAVQCQSMLQPAFEGAVDTRINVSVKEDKGIGDVILDAMKHYGFTVIKVDASRNVAVRSGKVLPGWEGSDLNLKALKDKDIEAKQGETAYGFCSRIFSRLGVVLRVDVNGELIIQQPNYTQGVTGGVHQGFPDPLSNRCISDIKIKETNRGQFSEVVLLGQEGERKSAKRANKPTVRVLWKNAPRGEDTPYIDTPTTELQAPRAEQSDGGVPVFAYRGTKLFPYKGKIVTSKDAKDIERCQKLATVHLCARAMSAFMVTVMVDGLTNRMGHIWDIDTLLRTKFDSIAYDEIMYCLTRVMKGDKKSGYTTALTLIPLESLQLGEVPTA